MRTISSDLSTSGFDLMASELDRISDSIVTAAVKAAMELAERAASVARASCPVDTGRLRASIVASPTATGAEVTCSAPYAMFVEFGTGVTSRGMNGAPASPLSTSDDASAMVSSGYVVDGRGRGDAGWVYPTNDGGFRFTHGQAGKHFMSDGAEAARADGYEVVLRAVGEVL